MITDARDVPLTVLEQDILSDLKAVAARMAADTAPDGVTTQQHPLATRPRRIRSRTVAVGVAVAVAGTGGYAVAAAAGELPNPWSGPAFRSIPFLTSSDPAALAGATVKLAVAGPESTTLEIVNDTVTVGSGTIGECSALVVKERQGRSRTVTTSCGGPSAARAENVGVVWQAPSGASFTIVTGLAPVGATKVALTDLNGAVTTEPTGGGYFVVYVPAQVTPANGTVDFYNSSGQPAGSQPFGASPARPAQ
jgi:hypothetical protein